MRRLFILFFLFTSCSIFAQQTALKGTVLNATTNKPVDGVLVQLKNLKVSTISSLDGTFYFNNLTSGSDIIVVSSPDIKTIEIPVNIIENKQNNIETIYVSSGTRNLTEEAFILLDEESLDEDADRSDLNVSSLLTSSNDVYLSSVSYNLSVMRFNVRGYENRYSDVYINGVNIADMERGGFSYSAIGGLNDVTRNKDDVLSMLPSSFSYNEIGGVSNFDVNAGSFSKGGRASIVYTNRAYKLRGAVTHSTGLMNNGWAFTGSAAYRWADEGFVEGTFYNSLALFLAAEKVFNDQHRLSITAFATPTQRGMQAASTQEAYDLLDNNFYNSNWGYQDGKKRNSKIATTVQPTVVFSHKWTPNKNTKLTTGLGLKYNLYGSTALNWYNVADPRPDYYKNLPSYQTDSARIKIVTQAWKTDPSKSQVDWNNLYYQNQASDTARYMVEERHNDQLSAHLNSVLNLRISSNVSLTGGVEASTTKGMHYKTVNDLLGAKYFLNINQFAERDGLTHEQAQYDANNPDRLVVKGDKFGYDYDVYLNTANAFVQNTHHYNKWDIYYGEKISYTNFYRYGNMRNGLALDNSYGKGETHSFINQSAKLGLAYKLSGRHIFSGNISYSTLPPLAYNAYLSPRVKDSAIPDLKSERVFSSDINYNFSTPLLRGRISAFQTNFYDQSELHNMYYDQDNTYVNFVLSGVERVNRGIELGAEVKINSNLSVSVAGTIAEYFYNNNPKGTVSYENGTLPDQATTAYIKDYYVGGTPQTAGTFRIHYFYDYWFFNVDINGFDRTYMGFAPFRRTPLAFSYEGETFEEKLAKEEAVTKQERFDGGMTVNLSVTKSLRIQKKYTLNINLQLCNILDNTDLKTGGYEQARLDKATGSIDKFPNKYYYAQGRNWYLSAGFRF